jgi:2-polyprenyl-3-methyl-5-hydroxy-6-metoxy-1,4-benzoquinol methylase
MSENLMENVTCVVCSEIKNSILYSNVQNRLNIGETFTIVQCGNCGFKFLNPRPTIDSITKYYDVEEYHPHKISEESLIDKVYLKVRNININAKKKLLNKLSPQNNTLLDVGCGTGEFLEAMQKHGWTVAGMETAKEARDMANRENIKIFDDLKNITDKFDIITMWHVLEHIHDVPELMDNLNRLLADDGFLIVAVPNIDSTDAKFYKENWIALDTPRHLYHFTPKDIVSLMDKFNFEVKQISNRLFFDVWYNALLSAQHQSKVENHNTSIWDLIKAGIIGKLSFLNGLINSLKSSSPIYIIQKKN